MRIVMVGAGYVGLVSGACFSEFGWDVVCVDTDDHRIGLLARDEMPIFEPGLEDLVARNVAAGRLAFTHDLAAAIPGAQAVFIAVGTPARRGDGHADLSYVYAAAEQIACHAEPGTVIVTKSTVPVGTGREIARRVDELRPDGGLQVAANPEFLREGSAIEDFMRPDRIVIGAETEEVRAAMRELYRPLFLRDTPIVFTSLETAEMIKYAANAFLATKITFINEFADLCERVGANVQDVARGIGLDGRIGNKFLHPGPGYGGSCFPKDARALVQIARHAGSPVTLVEQVIDINERRKVDMAGKIVAACGGSVAGKTIAVLGLTFKPNTDDMREAPSLTVLPLLVEAGASVRAFDPQGLAEARRVLNGITWCEDAYQTMEGADAVAILTEWNEFRALDLARAKTLLRTPLMIDLRNIYGPQEMMRAGFDYVSVGRPPVYGARARS